MSTLRESGAIVARYEYDAWGYHKVYSADGIDISNNSQYNEHVGNLNPIRYRSRYVLARNTIFNPKWNTLANVLICVRGFICVLGLSDIIGL